MEYTEKEQKALSLLGRTDFKNLSKTDVVSFVSMLGDMRPEVAAQALAQFPEFANLVSNSLGEYREMIGTVISSDDASLQQAYALSDKEMQSTDESKKNLYDLVGRVQADLSRCLDKENITPEERKDILNHEIEIVRLAAEKDEQIRSQQREIVKEAHAKDSEKRHFNWKVFGGISAAVVFVVGVGASLLGGKTDINLPKKS